MILPDATRMVDLFAETYLKSQQKSQQKKNTSPGTGNTAALVADLC